MPLTNGAVTDPVYSKKAPQLNQGRIKGSVRVLSGENFNINSGLVLDGSLQFPGSPQFTFNGGFSPPSIVDAGGSSQPSNYRITINGGVSLGGLTKKVDPEPLPTATAPVAGSGTRTVNINNPGDSPGNFATIRTLVINAHGGSIDLPPGRYDRITLNSSSSINLQGGTAGQPALYEIQKIDINSGCHVNVAGFAVLRIKNSLNLNGYMGNPSHPEWLDFSISNGSLTLNSQSAFHGRAVVPAGTLTVNGNSLLHGQAFTDKLVLNGNGIIECESSGGTPNLPPIAADSEVSTWIGEAVSVPLQASDPEGQTLTYQIVSQPLHGTLSGSGNALTYTPFLGFVGDDTFLFKVSDGNMESAIAAVTIHVFQPNRPPVAANQVVVLNQGEVNAPITLNAVDPDGDNLTFSVSGQPTAGVLGGSAPLITYSHTGPRSSVMIEDSLTFVATDSNGSVSQTGMITIQLQAVNRPPTGLNLSVETNEDTPAIIDVLAEDADGDPLTYQLVKDPQDPQAPIGPIHGTLSGTGPQWTYQPNPGFHGDDRFFVIASDGVLSSSPFEVSITISPVNDAPSAISKSIEVDEDQSAEILLEASDEDGDQIVFSYDLPLDFPGIIEGTGASLVFVPEEDFHGTAAFSFTATDSSGASSTGQIEITVAPVNDVPIALGNSLATDEGTTLPILLQATDVEDDALTYQVTTLPLHGSLSGTPPEFFYTPEDGYFGEDSFTFTAADADGTSVPATILISVRPVNHVPVATSISLATAEDTAIPVTIAATDSDGDAVAFTITRPPAQGTLSGTAPGFVYTPNPDWNGTDSFSYTASDAASTSQPAEVTILVTPVNDPPRAEPVTYTLDEDGSFQFTLSPTDVDGETLNYFIIPGAHGGLLHQRPLYTYFPNPDYNGNDSIFYFVSDSTTSLIGRVDLIVRPVNDAPVANAQTVIVSSGSSASFSLSGDDIDGDDLTFEIGSQPLHGTLAGNPPNLTYTPSGDYTGPDTFSFTASDGAIQSQPAIVEINVTPAGTVPIAESATYLVRQRESLTFNLSGSSADGDTLTYQITRYPDSGGSISQVGQDFVYTPDLYFTGTESIEFTATSTRTLLTSEPAVINFEVTPNNVPPVAENLNVTIDSAPVEIELPAYDPEGLPLYYYIDDFEVSQYIEISGEAPNLTLRRLSSGARTISFYYYVEDDLGLNATADVTVKLLGANSSPTITSSMFLFDEDTTNAFRVVATDPNSDPLSYSITLPPGSPLTIEGDGPEYLARLTKDFNGLATATVTVSDGRGGSATKELYFTVWADEDAPVFAIGENTTPEDTPIDLSVPATDPEGAPIAYEIVSQPLHGILSGTLPSIRYTPDSNFNGRDSFVISANDGSLTTTSMIGIDVSPVNDPPVANRAVGRALGLSTPIPLTGSDADGDGLSFRLVAHPNIGTASIAGGLLTFSTDEPFFGTLRLSYVANDGQSDSPPAPIVISGGVAPEARIISPVAGARLPIGEAIVVKIEAADSDGSVIRYELLANGAVAATGTSGELSWTPGQSGSIGLSVRVLDDSALSFTSAPLAVTVIGDNQAPSVFAGSDLNVFAMNLGSNLIQNGGCEQPLDSSGNVPFWERIDGMQYLTKDDIESFNPASGGIRFFPAASEGAYYFGPVDAENLSFERTSASLSQTVVLGETSPESTVAYLFKAKIYAHAHGSHIGSSAGLRQPRIELQFLAEDGSVLSQRNIREPVSNNTWHPAMLHLVRPADAVSLKVTLLDHREPGFSTFHYSLFDDIGLFEFQSPSSLPIEAATTLTGEVSDDGLPTFGQLVRSWSQLSGPPATLSDAGAATAPVRFSSMGRHVFKLTASDGEKSSSDTIAINVGSLSDGNAPPTISLASSMQVEVGTAPHTLDAGVIDDGIPTSTLYHYWEQISGPSNASIADTRSASTTFTVTVPGDYVFRLTSHDGNLASDADILVTATCQASRQPIDLMIVTDHSGSMFGPEPGVITDWDPRTPIYQARKLTASILGSLDPSMDRVSIIKNDQSSAGGGTMAFTSDMVSAAEKIIMPQGEFLFEGYDSATLPAIARIVNFVRTNGRAEARKIILHLNDGQAGFRDDFPTPAQIAGYGITTMSVSMANMKNDPINRVEISAFVSTPAHAFFVESLSDPAVVQNILKAAMSPLCVGFNNPPAVKAGDATYLPTVASVFQPNATVTDDQDTETLALAWEQVSGPAAAQISDTGSLRPSIRFTSDGTYVFKLSAMDGNSTSSDTVPVKVGANSSTPTPSGLIAYWPFDGSMRDLVGNRTLAPQYPQMPAQFVNDAKAGQALDLTGRTFPFHQIDGELFALHGERGGMAVSFWCKAPAATSTGTLLQFAGHSLSSNGNPYWPIPSLGVSYDLAPNRFNFSYGFENGNTTTVTSNPSIGAPDMAQWNHVVINYDNLLERISIYVNSTLSSTASYTSFSHPVFARNGQSLTIGPAPYSSGNLDRSKAPGTPVFNGMMDEVAIFNRSLGLEDIANLSRSTGLTPPSLDPAPVVDAGLDQVASLTDPVVQLNGFVSDDNASTAVIWSLQSGPSGGADITNPEQANTIVTFSSAGSYTFELKADDGFHTVTDTVEIRVDQPCTSPVPTGVLMWFKGEGDSRDAVGANDLHWNNLPAYTGGKIGKAFDFTGSNGILESKVLDLGNPNEITLEGWFRDNADGLLEQKLFAITTAGTIFDAWPIQATILKPDGLGRRFLSFHTAYLDTTGTLRNYNASNSSSTVTHPLGEFFHLAVTLSSTQGVSFYINGTLSGTTPLPLSFASLHIPTDPVLRLGGRNNLQIYPKLSVDEFTAYNRALDASEVLSIYQADSTGKCPAWAQPSSSSGYADAGASVILQQPGSHLFAGTFEADDFAPNPSVSWSQVAGPVPVSLTASDTLSPSAFFSIPGRYLFKLEVTDGSVSGTDTVIVDLNRVPNTAPVVTWTPPASIELPQNTVAFEPTVSDDGLPSGNVTSSWRMVAGPDQATFMPRGETPDPHDVIASFPSTGIYQIELLVSDGLLTSTSTFSFTVNPEPIPTDTNTAPLFSLGTDFTAVNKTVVLFPTVFDDGRPSGQLLARWDHDRGPGAPRFDQPPNATGPEASITFPLPGIYEIRLSVSDGELSTSDTVVVDVPASLFDGNPGIESAPILAEMAPQIVVRPTAEISLQPSFTDEDGPSAAYQFAWEQVAGPSPLTFSDIATASTTITFAELGTYVVKFTLTDGPFIRSRYITLHHLSAPNQAPTLAISPPGGTAAPMSTVTLASNAADDGNPGPLTYEWDWLESPAAGEPVFSAPFSSETNVTFPAPGDYVLYCRVSDGELTKHQTITYRVLGEPFLAILTPLDGGTVSDRTVTEAQIRAFRDGGSVRSVELSLDGINLGQARLELDSVDYFLNLPAMIHGSHSLTATATYDDGTVVTRSSQFQLADHAEEALVLEIESPHENTDDITAPTAVVATVKSLQLKDYRLEIAPADAPLAKRTIATGTTGVISSTIGILDPTLLENGIYTLTLSATTTTGLYAATSETVVIDGNMKLGQFSLAFEDMSIDLPGTPLSVTRTYDSRNLKGGDFGPGWSLATSSVKLRKTRPLNLAWEQNLQDNGFVTNWVFQVQPTQRKRIIITFPGGRSEMFETGIRAAVPVSSSLPNAQRYTAIYGARYHFTPVGDTQGRLEVDGDTEIFWGGVSNDFTNTPTIAGQFSGGDDSISDPTRFRYIEPGGAVYVIDETLGLLAVKDPNGNTLSINRNGVTHSAGESLLFHRNESGKITAITDNLGRTTNYTYDNTGRLSVFTNRLGHTNRFEYTLPAFPHYVTGIRDGNNIPAVRTNYDAEGRMVSQTDASGKSIHFDHEVADRRESITDRLGHVTTHEFDEFGNITHTTDALGGLTIRGYDANDNETSTTTPLGFTTTRSFDAKNNLRQEIDPLGHISSYSYDPEKRPLTISDALNHSTTLSYGANGNLTTMTDPAGASTDFSYTGNGNISTLTDANGTVTSYTHDSKGRETTMKVTAADGTILTSESYDYDASGNRTRTISTDGQRFFTTNYTYDAENRLTQTSTPDGTTTSIYDVNGKVTSETSPAGTTTFIYDSRGNLIQTNHPGTNRITRSGYDAEGRMTSSTDMAGATTYTLYDALGRSTATILPDETMPSTILTEVADIAAAPALADNPRSTTIYDADGRVTASTDALGNTTTFDYDDAGRRTAVIDALGNTTSYTYDAAGRQTSMTDARGYTTSFTYDAAGRLTRTDLPDGNFTASAYDTLGRRISSTDAEGNITQFAYDGAGRLIAVTDALGGTTRYGYDQRGMQVSQTDALGRTTRYEYDSMGHRTARILPQGQREEMTYNNLGQLTSHKDFNGRSITRTYEPYTQNLLSVVAPTNHPSLTLSHAPARYDFTYDVLGRRSTATVKNKLGATLSSETFTYDIRSQLTGYTGPTGTIGYGYDAAGNLAGAKSGTMGGYDVSYDYDELNRITMVYRGQEGIDPTATELAAYNYDANGNLNGSGYSNGVQHAYTYNPVNRLTDLGIRSRDLTVPSSSYSPLQGYSYQLDKNGHRTRISELGGRTINHTFDKLHRLTREVITSSQNTDHPALGTLAYTYDAVSNRNTRSSIGSVAQLLPYQGISFNANDRMASGANYDANGNTLSGTDSASAPFNDVYSFDNRLIRRSHADGISSYNDIVVDITYNADGHRLTKLVSDNGLTQRVHRYLTDANNPTGYAQVIEETDPLAPSGQQLKKVHLYGHDLISSSVSQPSTLNHQLLFYSYDGLGSVRGITNEDGTLEETYDYDAYGTLIGLAKRNAAGDLESTPIYDLQSAITKSEFLFTGEQWDSDLNMYFLRARYMDTNTGRFHTQDTYEGRNGEPLTLHKYLYGNGNPAMFTDPSGKVSLGETMAVGAMMGALNGAAMSYANGGSAWDIAFSAAGGAVIGAGAAPLMMMLPPPVLVGLAGIGAVTTSVWTTEILMSEGKTPGQKAAAIATFLTSVGGVTLANKWRAMTLFGKKDISLANKNPKFFADLLRRLGVEVSEQIYVKVPGFSRGRFYDMVIKFNGKLYGIEVKGSPAEYAKRLGIQAAKDEVVNQGGLPVSGRQADLAGISGYEIEGTFRMLFPFSGWQ